MKKQFLIIVLVTSVLNQSFSQEIHSFDIKTFENALISEMRSQFSWMQLDTTLSFATRATSQKEAGYPICYGTKKGGMVKTSNNEFEEAKRLVTEYKSYLMNVLYLDENSLKRCRFNEFCATATETNGLLRYGIVVDNNIKNEDLVKQ